MNTFARTLIVGLLILAVAAILYGAQMSHTPWRVNGLYIWAALATLLAFVFAKKPRLCLAG
jgi:uncharacterized membrane protein